MEAPRLDRVALARGNLAHRGRVTTEDVLLLRLGVRLLRVVLIVAIVLSVVLIRILLLVLIRIVFVGAPFLVGAAAGRSVALLRGWFSLGLLLLGRWLSLRLLRLSKLHWLKVCVCVKVIVSLFCVFARCLVPHEFLLGIL